MSMLHLAWIDYAIMGVYFLFVLGIGWFLKRQIKTSQDFFQSGHSLPLWITGLAFLSANLGWGGFLLVFGLVTLLFAWLASRRNGEAASSDS